MGREQFLQVAGLEMRTLELWIDQRWLIPEASTAGPSFSDRDLARTRFILDLRRSFGVNDEGIDVILHLVDQVHGLREALAGLRESMT